MDQHPTLAADRAAVVTGAASGIGLAAAQPSSPSECASVWPTSVQRAETAAATWSQPLQSVARRTVLMCARPMSAMRTPCGVCRMQPTAHSAMLRCLWAMPIPHKTRAVEITQITFFSAMREVNLQGVIAARTDSTQAIIDQAEPCAIVNTGSKTWNPPYTRRVIQRIMYREPYVKVLSQGLACGPQISRRIPGQRAPACWSQDRQLPA